MSIFTTNQKIGIELELYAYAGTSTVNDYLSENGNAGFVVDTDGSLSNDGAEIKFDNGIELCNSQSRIEAMYQMADEISQFNVCIGNDTTVFLGPDRSVTNFSTRGETGLHIHFGCPQNVNSMDLIRVLKNVTDNLGTIHKNAWRVNRQWGSKTHRHIGGLTSAIFNAVKNPNSTEQNGSLYYDKYIGVNFNNVGDGYNTIEFRFAHASLMKNPTAFETYLETLNNIFQSSVTGEQSTEFGDFILKETSRRRGVAKIEVLGKKSLSKLGQFNLSLPM